MRGWVGFCFEVGAGVRKPLSSLEIFGRLGKGEVRDRAVYSTIPAALITMFGTPRSVVIFLIISAIAFSSRTSAL